MSRYIDADAAIDKVDCLFRSTDRDKVNFMQIGYNHAVADCIAILKNLDTLEVVRCKDCVNFNKDQIGGISGYCGFHTGEHRLANWFCCFGKRREVTE